jgi:asparagine synthase (glutamine-hydrolysing)
MCGIAGWIDWSENLALRQPVLERMTETLAKRGPDAQGVWISGPCALGHRRLSVIDPDNGAQPMIRRKDGAVWVIVYNGELYNTAELREELKGRGHRFTTSCDTEVLLSAFIEWREASLAKLNGIFAFAVWNDREESLFLARDRVGVKPLFYSLPRDGTFLFGSELKAILAHPLLKPVIGREGLAEIFAIGPARTPGHGVFEGIHELKPGCWMRYDRGGLSVRTYWKLESREHEDDEATTAARVRELLRDTVERQLVSDVPIGTLLSGGLDSSALTAFAASHYRAESLGAVPTFSVDYAGNDEHFRASAFQPNSDAPWVRRMANHLGTDHRHVTIDTPELVHSLDEAVIARDLPGMADVDSSLLLFCREIRKDVTVALSGEAADEVFGGYPWFYRRDLLEADTFPWSAALPVRLSILSDEAKAWIDPEGYVKRRYEEALAEVPLLPGESGEQARMRQIAHLNLTRWMPTLLDRKDRMSMAVGLEVRVPYCDHRLIEYVWNVPWAIKTAGGREKGILRLALEGVLPEDVRMRKKSPFPKTHNPAYTQALQTRLLELLDDGESPLVPFINRDRIRALARSTDAGGMDFPWFGQLMSGPQLFAWLIQIDCWFRAYRVSVTSA